MHMPANGQWTALLACLFTPLALLAQLHPQHSCNGDHVRCMGIVGLDQVMHTNVPAPEGYTFGDSRAVSITVNYTGFTTEAQAAFQYAVDIWASLLTSDINIVVDATWEDIPGNTLGFAGATTYFANFSGAPQDDVFYPSALADKLAGSDLDPGQSDIVASFDSGTNWYLGTDGNPAFNEFDFVSVVLHELGHGLGVVGSATVDGGVGEYGLNIAGTPIVYDTFVENGTGLSILSYANNSTALAAQLEGGNLFWNGAEGVNANGGTNPELFAPDPFEPGSSYSHWDESYYPAGDSNSLMTPYIGFAEVIHDPGAATLGLLNDIGWDLDLAGGGGGCVPTGLTLTQEPCQEDDLGTLLPVIGITFGIDGICNVEDLCFSIDGGSYSCFDLPSLDFFMYDGDQINLTETTPNAVYTFYFTTANGTSSTFSFNNGNCTDGLGCTNIYADNYDPTATVDDGSCIFTQTICDCAGAEINIEVLTWLGDGFADDGAFQWNDGPFVDFNCETWGYDCGDISGAPSDDPWDVCSGNLPPNNGCEVIGDCLIDNINVYTEGCQNNSEVMYFLFDYTGDCTVSEICADALFSADLFCFPMEDNNLGDGDIWGISNLEPGSWEFYYTLSDGTVSPVGQLDILPCDPVEGCTNPYATNYNSEADVDDGSCTYNETICDCAGTEHTIGVLVWLGDTFADSGDYDWDEQPVDFNCDTWGYDCGDIEGSPSDDPWGVCGGGLPPNNGCEDAGNPGCTDATACNYDSTATVDDGSCEYTSCAGCTDPTACNYNATATLDDGSCDFDACAGCTNPNACNYDATATLDDGSCEFDSCAGCTNANACNYDPTATLDDGSCEFDSCAGCTEPGACNFDPTATINDGSCEYTSCAGCTDPAALNYDPTATIDDGSCFYTVVLGCIDPTACNYDATANTDDGSCEYETCAGCTDANACNYDATATLDDGSCEYESCAGCTDPGACNYDATATLDDGSCDYETCAGCTDEAALNYDPDATIDDGSCVYDCEYPTLSWSTFCEEGESDVFYIELDIDDLGNGAPYAITNSYNSDSFEVGFNGSVEIGPFPNDEQVLVTVTSTLFPNCLLTSPLLSDNCTDDSIEETDVAPAIFPNPTSDHIYVQSPVSGNWHTVLYGADGRIVAQTRLQTQAGENTLWTLPANLAPGLYTLRLAQNGKVFTERLVIR
ncbi:MAG: T9SS type A sorting domain-containing protein [Flavobacteriales bacterium]